MKGFEAGLDILVDKVPKMRARNLLKAKCNCKGCGGKDTVLITRGKPTSRGEVVRWACSNCNNRGMT